MGTQHYLINHEKKQLFELGKGIKGDILSKKYTLEEAKEFILCIFKTGYYEKSIDFEKWSTTISKDISKTIGFLNNEGITDYDEELFDKYKDYVIVGT